jgi:plasmid stabilization system protein ParE
MTLRLIPEAQADILEAAQWYENREPGLGRSFVEDVQASLQRVSDGPERFPVTYRNFRRAIIRRFPYAIYFAAKGPDTIVYAVLHQRRDQKLLDERQ